MVDVLKRTLKVPSRFVPFMEKHQIFELFHELANQLVIEQPDDHIYFLRKKLQEIRITRNTPRVILLAPPDFDKARLAGLMTKSLGCFLLSMDDVFDEDSNCDLDFDNSFLNLIDVDVVQKTQIILSRNVKCLQGWIMLDVPRNRQEAQSLQRVGILPTHTIHLVQSTSNAASRDMVKYNRQMFELKDVFRSTLLEVEIGDRSIEDLADICRGLVTVAPRCKAAMLPRVVIIGARGSGRQTQAKHLCHRFNLIHVSFESILARTKIENHDVAKKIRYYEESKMPTPPTLLASMLEKALLAKTCLDHGWVLTGFPRNVREFKALDLLTTPPNRVIFLDVKPSTCLERVAMRRINKYTGSEHNLCREELTKEISTSIACHPKDEASVVREEIAEYVARRAAMLKYSSGTETRIDGNSPLKMVRERVEAVIMRAAPFGIPRDPLASDDLDDDENASQGKDGYDGGDDNGTRQMAANGEMGAGDHIEPYLSGQAESGISAGSGGGSGRVGGGMGKGGVAGVGKRGTAGTGSGGATGMGSGGATGTGSGGAAGTGSGGSILDEFTEVICDIGATIDEVLRRTVLIGKKPTKKYDDVMHACLTIIRATPHSLDKAFGKWNDEQERLKQLEVEKQDMLTRMSDKERADYLNMSPDEQLDFQKAVASGAGGPVLAADKVSSIMEKFIEDVYYTEICPTKETTLLTITAAIVQEVHRITQNMVTTEEMTDKVGTCKCGTAGPPENETDTREFITRKEDTLRRITSAIVEHLVNEAAEAVLPLNDNNMRGAISSTLVQQLVNKVIQEMSPSIQKTPSVINAAIYDFIESEGLTNSTSPPQEKKILNITSAVVKQLVTKGSPEFVAIVTQGKKPCKIATCDKKNLPCTGTSTNKNMHPVTLCDEKTPVPKSSSKSSVSTLNSGVVEAEEVEISACNMTSIDPLEKSLTKSQSKGDEMRLDAKKKTVSPINDTPVIVMNVIIEPPENTPAIKASPLEADSRYVLEHAVLESTVVGVPDHQAVQHDSGETSASSDAETSGDEYDFRKLDETQFVVVQMTTFARVSLEPALDTVVEESEEEG